MSSLVFGNITIANANEKIPESGDLEKSANPVITKIPETIKLIIVMIFFIYLGRFFWLGNKKLPARRWIFRPTHTSFLI